MDVAQQEALQRVCRQLYVISNATLCGAADSVAFQGNTSQPGLRELRPLMSTVKTIDLIRFLSETSACSYLPEESSQLEYRVPWEPDAEQLRQLLRRGWRRFGNYVFRPQCPVCRKCRSIRIPVDRFQPSKSQRRALKRNSHIEVEVHSPEVTDDHVELFNEWHRDMALRRGWAENATSFQNYYESFIGGTFDFAREFRYWEGDRLVGIGLVDQVEDAVSSAYFYHDPAWRPLGPGTFSSLMEIEYARQNGLQYVYLGYWIQQNQSMNYKARFQPHELLDFYVDDEDEPVWRAADVDRAQLDPT